MSGPQWWATTVLGRLEPDPGEVARVVRALRAGRLEAPAVDRALSRSKVTRLAHGILSRVAEGEPLTALLRERVAADRRWRAAAYGYLGHALCEVAACGGRALKGLAVQDYYPEPELRHIGNVDAQFPTWSTALDAVSRLRRSGWEWAAEDPPRLNLGTTGLRYASLPLVAGDVTAPVRLDVHVGPYPVGRGGGMLPMIGWRRSETLGVPVEVPGVESAIVLVAACAVNDGFVSMKTINDLHVLVSEGSVDWISVRELCRTTGLEATLADCLAQLRAVYGDDAVPAPWRAGRSPRLRAVRAGDPAPGGGRGRPRPLGTGERRLLPAGSWMDLAASASPPDIRVLDLGDGLQVVTGGRGAALRVGGDVFVVTSGRRPHPDGVATARLLLAQARPGEGTRCGAEARSGGGAVARPREEARSGEGARSLEKARS